MPSAAPAASHSGCGRPQPPLTRPISFRFATEERASTAVKMLPTDELRMMQAEEEVREMRSSKTPESRMSTQSRSLSARSAGSAPLTETKPFRFKSEERHRKALESMQNKNNSAGRLTMPETKEEAKELAKKKVMRAREYADVWAPPKKETASGRRRPIVAKAPTFTSEDRIAYHREVVLPKKKMKEAAEERARRREQRLKEEEERREIKEYRKTLVPKARLMPNFFGPVFQPDYTTSQPATKGKEPRLSTNSRFGPTRVPPGGAVYSIHSPMERPDQYLGALQRQAPLLKGPPSEPDSPPLRRAADGTNTEANGNGEVQLGSSGRVALATLQQQLSNAKSHAPPPASVSSGSNPDEEQENELEADDVQAMVALRQQLSNAKMHVAPVVPSAHQGPQDGDDGLDDAEMSP